MVDPIVATLGFSYAQISLATSLRYLETGALSPFIGMAVDRWPPKRMILIGVIIIGLGYFCLSRVTNLTMFYISFLIVGLGSSLGSQIVATTTIARWFKRNMGKASGFLAFGIGIGGLFIPAVAKIVDTYGWQTSLGIFAIAMYAVGIPLSFVFRRRPQDYGMLPDGKPQEDFKGSGSAKTSDFSLSAREALKTRPFWYLGFSGMLQSSGVQSVILHVMPYLTSVGIARATASMVAMLLPMVSLPARFVFGWLTDIFPKKYMIVTSMLLLSIGLLLFSLIEASSFWLVILFVIVYSIGLGGVLPLRPPILREYFGTKNFGTIYGLQSIFIMSGMVMGPPVAGWVYDMRGVYDPIWLVFSGCCMAGAILMLTLPSAPRPNGNLLTT